MTGRRLGAALALVGLLALVLGGALFLRSRPTAHPESLSASSPAPRPTSPPWTASDLKDLLGAVESADGEGLRASDYRVEALRTVVGESRSGRAVDTLADAAALSLARDFAAGRIRNRHRFNWYIDDAGPTPAELAKGIAAARAQGRLRSWLDGLLPTSPSYRALRDALASTPAGDVRRDRLRANMERWRWLPRDVGQGDQLYVNLPTYRLDVIQGGSVIATYKAVIGATDMPTPALSVPVRQVIANPDWIVPQSIVRRSHLRPGASGRYIFTTRPDGTVRVRQKPGPGNALGRIKIVFPNPLAIYFHDTPSKSLFGASARTFSHGCVRVQNIEALAASLIARPDRLATALAGTATRGFVPARAWRATIVYLTLVPDAAGAIADVGDPYRLDERLAAALDGRKPRAQVAVPIAPTPQPRPAAPPPSPQPGPSASTDIDAAPAPANTAEPATEKPGSDPQPAPGIDRQ